MRTDGVCARYDYAGPQTIQCAQTTTSNSRTSNDIRQGCIRELVLPFPSRTYIPSDYTIRYNDIINQFGSALGDDKWNTLIAMYFSYDTSINGFALTNSTAGAAVLVQSATAIWPLGTQGYTFDTSQYITIRPSANDYCTYGCFNLNNAAIATCTSLLKVDNVCENYNSVTNFSPTSTTPTEIIPFLKTAGWKVQVPDNTPGINKDLQLSYKSEFFYGNDFGSAVIFRTPCNNKTTTGSTSPRSELREYYNGNEWSTVDGKTHSLEFSGSIITAPTSNPRVIIAQLFGRDNVTENGTIKTGNFIVQIRYIRCNGCTNKGELVAVTNEYRTRSGNSTIILDGNYVEGTRYSISMSLVLGNDSSSQMTILHRNLNTGTSNQTKVVGIVSTEAYFKAGCYLNLDPGVINEEFGMVLMTSVGSSHV